jgi:hypothetical protein
MAEDHSFWKRAWYLILVGAMGAAYFVHAVAVGVWELIKKPFVK